jgi:hypothetical protein
VDPRPLAQQCAEDNPREAYYAVVEEFCSTATKDAAAVAEVLTHFQTGVELSWLDLLLWPRHFSHPLPLCTFLIYATLLVLVRLSFSSAAAHPAKAGVCVPQLPEPGPCSAVRPT